MHLSCFFFCVFFKNSENKKLSRQPPSHNIPELPTKIFYVILIQRFTPIYDPNIRLVEPLLQFWLINESKVPLNLMNTAQTIAHHEQNQYLGISRTDTTQRYPLLPHVLTQGFGILILYCQNAIHILCTCFIARVTKECRTQDRERRWQSGTFPNKWHHILQPHLHTTRGLK